MKNIHNRENEIKKEKQTMIRTCCNVFFGKILISTLSKYRTSKKN